MIQWIQVIIHIKDFKAVSYYAQEKGLVSENMEKGQRGSHCLFGPCLFSWQGWYEPLS